MLKDAYFDLDRRLISLLRSQRQVEKFHKRETFRWLKTLFFFSSADVPNISTFGPGYFRLCSDSMPAAIQSKVRSFQLNFSVQLLNLVTRIGLFPQSDCLLLRRKKFRELLLLNGGISRSFLVSKGLSQPH